jgi:hypothetical protein
MPALEPVEISVAAIISRAKTRLRKILKSSHETPPVENARHARWLLLIWLIISVIYSLQQINYTAASSV